MVTTLFFLIYLANRFGRFCYYASTQNMLSAEFANLGPNHKEMTMCFVIGGREPV